MAVTFDNTVFTAAQSTSGLYALNTFTGTSLLSGATPVTINGTIDNPGSPVQVDINIAGVTNTGVTGTYLGYSDATNGNFVYYFEVNVAGVVSPVTIGVTNAPTLPPLNVATPVIVANVTAPISVIVPCYAEGTSIRTVRGEVAVEDLAVGDLVVTASGAQRPITWIGNRRADCAGHPAPRLVLPIRIAAGAIAPGMPARDLRVSPDHALFLDDVLVQARFLLNGSTIVREDVASVTYWHIELETHDVLIAENLPSESYLDVGNRHAFADGSTVTSLRPDFAGSAVEGEGQGHCAPLVIGGERLLAIRSWLAERARHLGARTTADPAIQLFADGMVVTPLSVVEDRFVYAVPEGVADLRLVSRSAVPAEMAVDSSDDRRLGIAVRELQLDGVSVALDDVRLGEGWNEAEAGFRWTQGDAALPAARLVVLTAGGLPGYPVATPRLCAVAEAIPLRMIG